MAHGYKTPGSGRKKGSRNRRTVERELQLAQAAAAIGSSLELTPEQIAAMLPKDLLMMLMRQYLLAGDLDKAGAIAIQLAPYFHPKLQAVMVNQTPSDPLSEWTDGELDRVLASLRRAAKPNGRRRVH